MASPASISKLYEHYQARRLPAPEFMTNYDDNSVTCYCPTMEITTTGRCPTVKLSKSTAAHFMLAEVINATTATPFSTPKKVSKVTTEPFTTRVQGPFLTVHSGHTFLTRQYTMRDNILYKYMPNGTFSKAKHDSVPPEVLAMYISFLTGNLTLESGPIDRTNVASATPVEDPTVLVSTARPAGSVAVLQTPNPVHGFLPLGGIETDILDMAYETFVDAPPINIETSAPAGTIITTRSINPYALANPAVQQLLSMHRRYSGPVDFRVILLGSSLYNALITASMMYAPPADGVTYTIAELQQHSYLAIQPHQSTSRVFTVDDARQSNFYREAEDAPEYPKLVFWLQSPLGSAFGNQNSIVSLIVGDKLNKAFRFVYWKPTVATITGTASEISLADVFDGPYAQYATMFTDGSLVNYTHETRRTHDAPATSVDLGNSVYEMVIRPHIVGRSDALFGPRTPLNAALSGNVNTANFNALSPYGIKRRTTSGIALHATDLIAGQVPVAYTRLDPTDFPTAQSGYDMTTFLVSPEDNDIYRNEFTNEIVLPQTRYLYTRAQVPDTTPSGLSQLRIEWCTGDSYRFLRYSYQSDVNNNVYTEYKFSDHSYRCAAVTRDQPLVALPQGWVELCTSYLFPPSVGSQTNDRTFPHGDASVTFYDQLDKHVTDPNKVLQFDIFDTATSRNIVSARYLPQVRSVIINTGNADTTRYRQFLGSVTSLAIINLVEVDSSNGLNESNISAWYDRTALGSGSTRVYTGGDFSSFEQQAASAAAGLAQAGAGAITASVGTALGFLADSQKRKHELKLQNALFENQNHLLIKRFEQQLYLTQMHDMSNLMARNRQGGIAASQATPVVDPSKPEATRVFGADNIGLPREPQPYSHTPTQLAIEAPPASTPATDAPSTSGAPTAAGPQALASSTDSPDSFEPTFSASFHDAPTGDESVTSAPPLATMTRALAANGVVLNHNSTASTV